MRDKLIFIDAETDGLYGFFLSAAMKLTDQNGNILKSRYYGLKKEILKQVQTEWVKENVLPVMGDYEECENEDELLRKVWDFWMEHREEAYMVGDVIYPVEAHLMRRCVELDLQNNCFEAPFPMLDLSAMLYAKGIDPLADRYGLLGRMTSGQIHNPQEDIDVAIEVWKQYISRKHDAAEIE